MLWTPESHFNWSVDNFGATFTDAGLGANVPGHANANTKGANTALLVGIAEDCYGIAICFSGGSTAATIRRQMVDLLIDPAAGVGNAGSVWSVAINNLYANSPCFGTEGAGGYRYYFPLYLAKGTAIGARHQDLAAGTTALRVSVQIFGKPTRPDLVRVGTRVQTLGATTATTTGVAVTPGTNVLGSYSGTLGTLSLNAWWWQVGIGSADTTMTAAGYQLDVAVNATVKETCIDKEAYGAVGANEQAWKLCLGGLRLPVRNISSGQDVYVRGSCAGTPDTTMTAVVYALGS